METPIYSRLCGYYNENRIPFAMPGHKNMRGIDFDLTKCDVTELAKTMNLMSDDENVTRACELLGKLYGARKSFILTCGSTSGVQTMILSCLVPGDTLLAAADCHMSVINICAVAGINIKFVKEVTAENVTDDINAVFVTSPNYYGVTKDIQKISELCRKRGIVLMTDEAHGAHFMGKNGLPQSAVMLGADIVCQSAHKTLNALTGAAYLHIATDRVDINRVKKAIKAVHTSSPSYLTAASADIARAVLEITDYSDIIKECNEFKDAVKRLDIDVLENDDPTRVVIGFSKYGLSGFEVADELSEKYGIDTEMADLKNVVMIVSPYNKHSDFLELFFALQELLSGKAICEKETDLPEPPEISGVISPSKGWFAKSRIVDLSNAVGETAARTVCVYPPGTAVIATGGMITETAVSYIETVLMHGAEVSGIENGKIEVVV